MSNPIKVAQLNHEWQECGRRILENMAQFTYWDAVPRSIYPQLIRDWNNLKNIDNINIFEKMNFAKRKI